MDRLACVNVIALPLQLLGHRHPDWVDQGPMAVVDEDAPHGTITWVDKEARRARIRPGMRYAEGVSIRRDLRAGTVAEAEIDEVLETIIETLRDYSPFVEADGDETGIFWLDAGGLADIFESPAAWGDAVADELLKTHQLYSSVVVGFTRFGTYAVARAAREVVVFSTITEERGAARGISLRRAGLAPDLCDRLEKLGVETVGQFIRLPPAGIQRRFGEPAHRFHRRARGDLELPLQADLSDGPIQTRIAFDGAVTVESRLVFAIKRQLNPLFGRLADRQHKVTGIELALRGGGEPLETLRIRPASPTTDASRLMELIRLKLENRSLDRGIASADVTVRTRRPEGRQMQLFAEEPPRDLEAANRALERLRAEFGRRAVIRAVLNDAHLPEARFEWEPLQQLETADPAGGTEGLPLVSDDSEDGDRPGLIRRLWPDPRPLHARQTDGDQLELPSGDGVFLGGPYLVSGAWWVREVRRAYYFAQRSNGELLWLFWDERRDRWFEQGKVE
ncbi:MAG: DNA polymerase Y family protein [Bradymonadaceae bacterium]